MTKKLKQIAIETPHSLDDLAEVKYCYQLTDAGVELIAYNASRNALSLFDTITRMQVMLEYDLGAGFLGSLSYAGTLGSNAGSVLRRMVYDK